MAYNNVFPVGYQPAQIYYPQQYAPQPQQMQNVQGSQQQMGNSSIIWVQGEAGAKSYLVAPNSTVQLWDSEKQTIYLKSADASGMPSMKTLDYTIRDLSPVNAPVAASMPDPNYATKADLKALYGRLEALEMAFGGDAKPNKKMEAKDSE